MRPSSERALSFLISFTLLIGAVLVYSLLVVPSYRNIQILRNEAASKSLELENLETALEKLDSLLRDFQSLSSARETMKLTLPNDPNIAQVVNTISGLATINNLDISRVGTTLAPVQTLNTNNAARNIGAVSVRFGVTGQYKKFTSFLESIERNVRLMDVVSIGINSKSDGTLIEKRGDLDFDVTLQTYYQLPETLPSEQSLE